MDHKYSQSSGQFYLLRYVVLIKNNLSYFDEMDAFCHICCLAFGLFSLINEDFKEWIIGEHKYYKRC